MPDAHPVPDAETIARWAESGRQAEVEFEVRREAWGPEWPAWLSMTDIEPESDAFI